jgi:multiple sugar transport system ATP-binding protein
MSEQPRQGGIVLEHVSKVYPNGFRAVNDISLEIGEGEFMVLVGPSGCGKSTLLRMVAGLEEVSDGTVWIGGRDVTDAAPRARDIAMVFQNYALYPHMTVRDNLAFGLKMRKTPKTEITRRVSEVAKILGLNDMLDRKPGQLSGGQRQRVAMGRAMVREPAAYLMDEPLSNLDAKLRVAMRAELARLHERLGVTTVYVTHDQVEAMTLGQRVAVLRDGLLQQCDAPQVLFDHPANLFVAAFIGSPAMNLVDATVGEGTLTFAGTTVPVPPEHLPEPGRRVILGVRPDDLTLAEDGARAKITVPVEIVEELGAESNVIFSLDAPPVTTEHVTAAQDAASDDEARLLMDDQRSMWTARLNGRRHTTAGTTVDMALDTGHMHFFDPDTGATLTPNAVATV